MAQSRYELLCLYLIPDLADVTLSYLTGIHPALSLLRFLVSHSGYVSCVFLFVLPQTII
jgi:hypothetical protein